MITTFAVVVVMVAVIFIILDLDLITVVIVAVPVFAFRVGVLVNAVLAAFSGFFRPRRRPTLEARSCETALRTVRGRQRCRHSPRR